MSSYFDQMIEKAKENSLRWKEIDKLCDDLKSNLESKKVSDETLLNTVSVVLMLVEQLRPIHNATDLEEQTKDLQKGLQSIFSMFGRKEGE